MTDLSGDGLGWRTVTLGDLGTLHCGQSPASADVNLDGKGTVYVTGPEQWHGNEIVSEKWTTDPKRIAPANSIFIAVKGAGVGKMVFGTRAAIGRDVYAFEPHPELNQKFVFWAIKEGVNSIVLKAIGDIPGISKSHITDHLIQLPNLRTQQAVVAKIEELFSELDNGVESLTLARAQLKTYRQALLKLAFEGKLTADWRKANERWRETKLGDEIIFLTSGSRGWADYYAEQGEIFIRAQNLKHDRLDLSDIAYVQLPKGNSEGMRTKVQVGDVLITITGANVTKTGIVSHDLGTAYVSQHVALCRPGASIVPEFLYWYLLAETGGRKQLSDAAYGAGKPGLNLENIREVTLSLPPLDEQIEIVSRITAALSLEENIRNIIETEQSRTNALRQSILKKAFSGRLVAQDPNDEPASARFAKLQPRHNIVRSVKSQRSENA